MNKSRTNSSLKNARIALFFYLLNLLLTFFSRKYFINYLGADVLGLNTTALNLLGFLNLAELGIGAAISYALYQPIYDNDRKTISDIITVQGWFYRRIAYIIIGAAIILMCFFPIIFKHEILPYWYAYATFGVLLFSQLLSYFVNYKQIIFSACQEEYRITIIVQGIKVIKVIFQILAIVYLSYGYIWWLGIEFLFSILTSLGLKFAVDKYYGWLHIDVYKGKSLSKEYPLILKKTYQLFYHKIAGFVLLQASPLLIYAFSNLREVAIYGNYMLIVNGGTLLIGALFNSMAASIGNLIAEGNRDKIINIYWSIYILRVFMATLFCYSLYHLSGMFITLWIGDSFVMNSHNVLLITVMAFVGMTRNADQFISGYGIYHDTWAPIVESLLNIMLSIILGIHYGITGVLYGLVISQIIIVLIWKSYFLFHSGFQLKFRFFMIGFLKLMLIVALTILIANSIYTKLSNLFSGVSFVEWIILGTCTLITLCCLLLFFSVLIQPKIMRDLYSRIKRFNK